MSKMCKIVLSIMRKNKARKGDREWVTAEMRITVLNRAVKKGPPMTVTFNQKSKDSDRVYHVTNGRRAPQTGSFLKPQMP